MTITRDKLKKKIEELTCNSLKNRITLFSTWYHKGGSQQRGRASIVLDGIEIYEAIQSENEVFKALALINRRFGKRKLKDIKIEELKYESNKILFQARCEAEGIKIM
ncbi:hypothetical protein [Vallitalea guaymasensis]